MKNVKRENIKNCLFFDYETFGKHLKEASNGTVTVDFDCIDGLFFTSTEDEDTSIDVNDMLSIYFGVNVTSIHADDCEYIGVWLAYTQDFSAGL